MIKESRRIIRQGITTLAATALGLVSALAWNDAIKAIISRFSSGEESLTSRITYAIIATVIAIAVVYLLGRSSENGNEKEVK